MFLGGTKCTKASDFPPVGNVSSLFFYPPSPAYSRPKTMALNTLLLFTTHLLVLAPISSHSPLPTKYSHFSDTLSSSNLRHNLHVFHPRSPVFLLVSVGDLFLNFTTHFLFLQPHLKIREPFKEPPLLPVFQIWDITIIFLKVILTRNPQCIIIVSILWSKVQKYCS